MRFTEFEKAISKPRLARYLAACGNQTRKTTTLYRCNIRLSQEIFSVLNIFEITLRNAIDNFYTTHFQNITGSPEWLLTQSSSTGFLAARGCQKTQKLVIDCIENLGANYNHNKLVAELGFGFWRFLFASKQFMAAGSKLLTIFPARPLGINHTDIYNKLTNINSIRNRIAHHEPICFGTGNIISTNYAHQRYDQIIDLLTWLGYNASDLLFGIDKVIKEINFINTFS